MKVTVLSSAIALFALTALAAEPEKAPRTDTQQQAAKVPEQSLSAAPATQQQPDSALVRAAKRTGRLGKKPSIVITNDTLAKSGGHFTTTQSQETLPAAKPAATKTAPARKTKTPAPPDNSQAAKDAAAKRAMADYMEESIETVREDPAAQEGVLESAAPKVSPKPAQPPGAANQPPNE